MNMSVTDTDAAIADLTCGALFDGMRSCKYLDTSGKESKKTKRLEVKDVRFFTKDSALVAHKNLETHGHTVEFMLVKYHTQKNREKNETIMNRRNVLDLDPIIIWMRIIKRLVKKSKDETDYLHQHTLCTGNRQVFPYGINNGHQHVTKPSYNYGLSTPWHPYQINWDAFDQDIFHYDVELEQETRLLYQVSSNTLKTTFLPMVVTLAASSHDSTMSLYLFFTCKEKIGHKLRTNIGKTKIISLTSPNTATQ